jgi:hypothetical protein
VDEDTTTQGRRAARIKAAMRWAEAQGCTLQFEGEVGIGRECVGLVRNESYVDLDDYGWPPDSVTDAYHKHDCVCVLGRGDGPVDQLLDWIEYLQSENLTVRDTERVINHPIERLLFGSTRSFIGRRV